MSKSIETIWKEGFLKNDALIAPKINDLYNKKSIDIVEKFKRMYKINIIAIVVFALILLPVSTITKMPYMGMPMFFLFMTIVFFAVKFKNKLNEIDNSLNSFQYLQSFNNWIQDVIDFNTKLSRFLYPYVFISMLAGFWFGGFGEGIPGMELVSKLESKYPDMLMLFGLPVIGIIMFIVIILILAYFGGIIGKWDFDLAYGRIVKRLNTLIKDMDELRSEN